MSGPESPPRPVAGVAWARLSRRFVRWWGSDAEADRYLAAATDHADLERRIRVLERARRGPAFVTFNH